MPATEPLARRVFHRLLAASVCLVMAWATPAWAQDGAAPGAQLFARDCAACHDGTAASRAPTLEALRARTPQAIMDSLLTGAMRPQGARLSGAERRLVAEFVSGRPFEGDVAGAARGRCEAGARVAANPDRGSWNGWSPASDNRRHQSMQAAGLGAADLARLRIKWAFGFPDASLAWAQPTVVGGRVYVGSQNGTVYALDAERGCIHWTFGAPGGVRTAIVVGPGTNAGRQVVYFGDTAANAHALDAETGVTLWRRQVDEHPSARVTGSPVLHEGRLYVPVASYEEAQGANPAYACCTFRGSVVALDARTGAVVWKSHTITEPLQQRGTSTEGVTLWGPAGAGIWSAPTVDAARGALYVATGNAYSAPAADTTDAVVAFELETGDRRWSRQVTPGDVYVSNCRAGNPNCPETLGPDHDFGSPPMLVRAGGRDLLVVGQKSGVAFALDPSRRGEIVWQYRAGQGGVLGGIEWGAAADGERAYFAVSDITTAQPGGLHAVGLERGQPVWVTLPPPPICTAGRGCSAAQSAAVTVIDGAVLSGSVDGAIRAYSTATGEILWTFDTNRDFETVNGVPGKGASMIGPGPVVAGGMVYVNSGYGAFGGRAGNVLLAFGLE